MKKTSLWMFAVAVVSSIGVNAVRADEVLAEPVEQVAFWESDSEDSWLPSFSTTPTLSAEADLLLFQVSNGLGTVSSNVLGPDPGYRLAVSGMNADGLGLRATYMDFSSSGTDPLFGFNRFETYNIDLEVFKRFDVTDRTMIELSGGVRHNHTRYTALATQSTFDGIGVLVGAQAGFQTSDNGLLYTRAKWAMMNGNGRSSLIGLQPLKDQIRSQTELAIGYQHLLTFGKVQVTPRVGYEVQTWDNYGSAIVGTTPTLGLSGFVLGLGVAF